jgi:hypothetical protein
LKISEAKSASAQSFQTNDGELVETLNQFPTFVLINNSQQFIIAFVNCYTLRQGHK